MNGVQWFKEDVSFKYNDIIIEAEIHYWALDYKIKMVKPIEIELLGKHLPYAPPSRYVIRENNKILNVKNVDLLKKCKHQIISELNRVNYEQRITK